MRDAAHMIMYRLSPYIVIQFLTNTIKIVHEDIYLFIVGMPYRGLSLPEACVLCHIMLWYKISLSVNCSESIDKQNSFAKSTFTFQLSYGHEWQHQYPAQPRDHGVTGDPPGPSEQSVAHCVQP